MPIDFGSQVVNGDSAFRTPGSKRRLEVQPQNEDVTSKKQKSMTDYLLHNNQFSPLKDDDEGNVIIADTPKMGKKTVPENLPPIILHTVLTNPKDTFKKVQEWAKFPVYFKKMNDVRHVYATNKNDFNTIKQNFNDLDFKYQTFKPKDEIPKKLILKGLDGLFSPEEILDDLKKQTDSVIQVKQLTKLDIPIDVYLVYFKFETRLSTIMKTLKYCCYHKIKLEHFNSNTKKKVTQCYRCQGYGHQSHSCNLDFRCVKCTESHAPGACSKTNEEKNATCVNCNGSHPANYRGCIKAIEYLKKKRSNKNQNPNSKKAKHVPIQHTPARTPARSSQKSHNTHTQRRLNFADVVKNQHHTQSSHTQSYEKGNMHRVSLNNIPRVGSTMHSGPFTVSDSTFKYSDSTQNFSFISGEIDSLFGVSMYELMNSINNFVPQYRNCTDRMRKQVMLLEFIFTFVN